MCYNILCHQEALYDLLRKFENTVRDCEVEKLETPALNEKGKRGHHFLPFIFLIGINAEDGSGGAVVGGIGIVIGSHYEYLRVRGFLPLR